MDALHIGGVPEHFNLPWHLAQENQFFEKEGLDLTWHTCNGGTGQMCTMLEDGKLDVAILLTEGAVKHIFEKDTFKILQVYINTPLVWGVHTAILSKINTYSDVFDNDFAISRLGSGSHLMPQVDAFFKGSHIKDDQWEVIKDLEGALNKFKEKPDMTFYWEKFTTKPYVDKGSLKRVGEFITPWPCFVIVARKEVINDHAAVLKRLLKVINYTSEQLMQAPNAIDMFIERYNMLPEDAHQWFYMTEWATEVQASPKMLQNVMQILNSCGVISEVLDVKELTW